jgi:hypothetical protein
LCAQQSALGKHLEIYGEFYFWMDVMESVFQILGWGYPYGRAIQE